jgi:hypothetical protein
MLEKRQTNLMLSNHQTARHPTHCEWGQLTHQQRPSSTAGQLAI